MNFQNDALRPNQLSIEFMRSKDAPSIDDFKNALSQDEGKASASSDQSNALDERGNFALSAQKSATERKRRLVIDASILTK